MGKKVFMSLCFLAWFAVGRGQESPPNIVFILADDLGWGELGCYGNSFNETPNLDKLASQGIRFTQAYAAAPVCSPTRVSIMTGQYPVRSGITDFLAPKSTAFLDPQQVVTVNEPLGDAGYHTGLIGKWHLDTHFGQEKGGPAQFHFDEVIASETRYIADGDYFYPYDKISTLAEGSPGEYLTDRQSREAVRFIDRNKDHPFFLYLSFYAVHTKLDAPDSLVNKYKRKFDLKYGKGSAEKLFGEANIRHQARHVDNPWLAAMLERVDAGVGLVMDALKKAGLEKNTLLVFFSDNGGAQGVANNGGLRGHKTWLYEGGIREPLIVRWPGVVQANTVSDVPVCSVDFFPTWLQVAHAKRPERQACDGVDLSRLLTHGEAPRRDGLYWYYPAETGQWKKRMSAAIRQGDFKLIYFFAGHRAELYNIRTDPLEKTDLARVLSAKAAALQRQLNSWMGGVGARTPLP